MISVSSLVFTLALSSLGALAAPGPGLSVSAPKSVGGVENFKQTAVINTGNETITHSEDFSKRMTPFPGCTPLQVQSITQAATNAATLLTQTATYLQGITAATPRWTTWFGTYSEANRQTILSYPTRITAAGGPSSTVYNCNCNVAASLLADVDPTSAGSVSVCPTFFNAPATGTNSMAGVILRANTRLIGSSLIQGANTQDTCRTLASTRPNDALKNAYNIEYFAEDIPILM